MLELIFDYAESACMSTLEPEMDLNPAKVLKSSRYSCCAHATFVNGFMGLRDLRRPTFDDLQVWSCDNEPNLCQVNSESEPLHFGIPVQVL